jgi:hypothetical protein
MTLEGRIRELGLHEVCQLVGLSRKTGVLEIRAPLQDAAASIAFVMGAIVHAAVWPLGTSPSEPPRPEPGAPDRAAVEACVLDLLAWRDGEFRFVAGSHAAADTGVRIAIEPVLVEAAQRAAVWERVADRIPGARAVPAFVDVESEPLPLLRLAPQEWELLTRVDGKSDLAELSRALHRDLVDVAGLVHGLIGHGVLTLRGGAPTRRRHATPPSTVTVQEAVGVDLWIPDDDAGGLFDPMQAEPFQPAESAAVELCRRGDEAARRGDLAAAVEWWNNALQPDAMEADTPNHVDVGRIREAIALAARLHALLQPSSHDALSN